MSKVTFNNKSSVFYNDLKIAVEKYFQERKLQKTGNWKLYVKTAVLIPSAVALYLAVLLFDMPVLLTISLGCLFGFALASIGFNVMHDACHGSYSSRKWLNNILGLSLNALGGNAFIWKFKHNIIHHTYTNVDGIDDDIAKSPVMRQCITQKWVPAHRFQHFYVWFFYAISTILWIFIMDFSKYFSRRIMLTPLQKMDRKEHILFWLSKFLYVVFYIAVPVFFMGWGPWAIFFTSFQIVMGLTLAIVFQLAHVVEHTEFELAGVEPKHIENEWAVHQVKTTANFAPRNKIISWYVGGLNYQVEHHLFPKVSHVHYPAISSIVEKTCRRFNLPYNKYPTMTEAIGSHFKMLRELGKKPRTYAVQRLQ